MADAECEQQVANENDFDIMHVDAVPAIGDREDLSLSATNNPKDVLPGATLFDKVDETKLAQRANRFGTDVPSKKLVVDESELNLLYHSFEIDNHEGAETKQKIRLNAIHLRGVENMNTQDILDYFKDYSPVLVEWINDQSCNVVWSESTSSARAMLDLSRPIQRNVMNKTSASKELGEEIAIASEPEEGEDVEMIEQENDPRNRHTSDSEAQHSHFRRNSGDQSSTPVPNNSPVDSSQIDDVTSLIGTAVDSSKIKIPVPPGHWRIGNSTEKAKALLLRFACRSDRKHPGAEKLSQYYVKHGNPNYKGLKGIISSSYKSKVLDGRKRPHYVDLDAPTGDNLYTTIPSDSEDDLSIQQEQTKRPRMRMYADEEEEKQKNRSSTSTSSALHPGDLRNRIVHEKSLTLSHPTSLDDLRTRLYSRQPWNTPQEEESFDQELADVQSLLTPKNLSMPIVVGDLRNKLEKLRQARQPKVPLLIEVTQDEA